MKNIKIEKLELEDLAVCAFRYALGRMTYITWAISTILQKQARNLSDTVKQLMIDEIGDAIDNGKAGWDCDVAVWQDLREVLLNSKATPKGDKNEKGTSTN